MSLWRIPLILSVLAVLSQSALANVYLYEVVTASRRFQTASMMEPTAFLRYSGGSDIIYRLKVVDRMPGNDFNAALEKFKLTDRNYRPLNPEPAQRTNDFNRFIWWR